MRLKQVVKTLLLVAVSYLTLRLSIFVIFVLRFFRDLLIMNWGVSLPFVSKIAIVLAVVFTSYITALIGKWWGFKNKRKIFISFLVLWTFLTVILPLFYEAGY